MKTEVILNGDESLQKILNFLVISAPGDELVIRTSPNRSRYFNKKFGDNLREQALRVGKNVSIKVLHQTQLHATH